MTEREQIELTITTLESHRALLGELVVETALGPLRQKLNALEAQSSSGQRKQATVLFADVSGFTAMSETMDAEEVRNTMNAVWERLDAAITAHGGVIDKHIGDAVMALWGAQVAREDDPERAVRAALAMQAELVVFNDIVADERRSVKNPGPPISLRMRIGINTGPVLFGSVGTTGEFTAMGDTVNLASRLEHAAPVGEILISHYTYRHVRGVFDVDALEPMKIKGKTNPVQVYLVEGAKPRAFRIGTRGVEGVETRMIGRETELALLQGALRATLTNNTLSRITILGEAGVGKSRLLYEFLNWCELQPEDLVIFRGRASEEMSGLPYALARDVFFARFDIQDSDSLTSAREKLVQGVVEFLGAEAIEKAHFIGHLIGLDFIGAGSPYLQGLQDDARQIRARAFHYATQFFEAASQLTGPTAGGAVMLLIEDMHWADDGSLDLLAHLLKNLERSRILFVALARPALLERRADWQTGERIELQPLSTDNSRELVVEVLRRAPEIPAALQDLVVSRAEGNPLYVEELIKMLIDDGVIVVGAEAWSVAPERLAEGRIPPTLTGILQARLDNLPPAERNTLQEASVVGRVCWDQAVANLQTISAEHGWQEAGEMPQLLAALHDKEMMARRETSAFAGTEEYAFKHALLHDVAYESVLKMRRRVYHAEVARWLIEHSGERADEYAALIAHHHEWAGENVVAANWYARAGRKAQEAYVPAAAVAYYQKALEFRREAEEKGALGEISTRQLYDNLGEMLRWQARFDEALEAYQAMRADAELSADVLAQMRAWNGLGKVRINQGNHKGTIESAEQVENLAQVHDISSFASHAHLELARALRRKGMAFMRLGNAPAALDLGQRSLDLSTQLDNRWEVVTSLDLIAAVYDYLLGDYERAAQAYRQALALWKESNNRYGMGIMLNNLGENARLRMDFRAAVEYYQQALDIAREIGSRDGEMSSNSNLGGAWVALGEYARAEAHLQKVVDMAAVSGWGWIGETYRFLAQAQLGLGKYELARASAKLSLELAQKSGSQEEQGYAWQVLALIAMQDQLTFDGLATEACFERSHALFVEAGSEKESAKTLQLWAEYVRQAGDPQRADQIAAGRL